MNKKLSFCVKFIARLSLLSAFVWAVFAPENILVIAADVKATSEISACVLARSSRISDELFVNISDALKENVRCRLNEAFVENPLLLGDEPLWGIHDGHTVVGLWVSRSIDGRELWIRGVDFVSQLQFGMEKATTHNLTNESALETFVQLIHEVFKQHPFQGIVWQKEFAVWGVDRSAFDELKGALYLPSANSLRHPLLPVLMSERRKGDSVGAASIKGSELSRVNLKSKDAQRALDEGKGLWLKLSNE